MPAPFLDLALLRRCVGCGDCLPACPTYLELGTEADSPRGRLGLMAALAEQRIPLDAAAVRHFDLCLGCGACAASCPHEVPFRELLDSTRAHVESSFSRPRAEAARRRRVLRWLPRAEGLESLLPAVRVLQRWGLWDRVRGIDPLAEWIPPLISAEPVLPRTEARGRERAAVGLFLGCLARLLTPGVAAAAVRVLSRNGFSVLAPPSQSCCGAVATDAGDPAAAAALARRNIEAFGDCATILVTGPSCASALAAYARRLGDDPAYAARAADFSRRVRDVAEFLLEAGVEAPRRRLPARVALHASCAGKGGDAARALLQLIPGLEVLDVPEDDVCCGGTGVYPLTQPEMARRLRARLADSVQSTGASAVAACDAGCLLQLQAGLRERGLALRVGHPIEYLDDACP